MSELTEYYPWMTDTRFIGPAQVMGFDESGSDIFVRVENDFGATEHKVRNAIPYKLCPGDIVLVLGDDPDHMYIIGIIEQKTVAGTDANKIVLEGGTHAVRDKDSVKIFSRKRELLFEYDEKNGKSRINLESGDMEFITRNGNINFVAGKDIFLNGRSVGITSRIGIAMGITDSLEKLRSFVTIKKNKIQLNSQEFSVKSQKADLELGESNITGNKFSADFGTAQISVNRMETMAQTVISKAKNIYQTVEQLSQLKTGRMRTIVENTFHLKSKKAMLKSEDDFKVRAEKIHLG